MKPENFNEISSPEKDSEVVLANINIAQKYYDEAQEMAKRNGVLPRADAYLKIPKNAAIDLAKRALVFLNGAKQFGYDKKPAEELENKIIEFINNLEKK